MADVYIKKRGETLIEVVAAGESIHYELYDLFSSCAKLY